MWELLGKPPLPRSGVGQPGCPESSPQTNKDYGMGGGCPEKLLAQLVFIFSKAACWPDCPLRPSGTGSHVLAFVYTLPSCQQRYSFCLYLDCVQAPPWAVTYLGSRRSSLVCPEQSRGEGCKDGSSLPPNPGLPCPQGEGTEGQGSPGS